MLADHNYTTQRLLKDIGATVESGAHCFAIVIVELVALDSTVQLNMIRLSWVCGSVINDCQFWPYSIGDHESDPHRVAGWIFFPCCSASHDFVWIRHYAIRNSSHCATGQNVTGYSDIYQIESPLLILYFDRIEKTAFALIKLHWLLYIPACCFSTIKSVMSRYEICASTLTTRPWISVIKVVGHMNHHMRGRSDLAILENCLIGTNYRLTLLKAL